MQTGRTGRSRTGLTHHETPWVSMWSCVCPSDGVTCAYSTLRPTDILSERACTAKAGDVGSKSSICAERRVRGIACEPVSTRPRSKAALNSRAIRKLEHRCRRDKQDLPSIVPGRCLCLPPLGLAGLGMTVESPTPGAKLGPVRPSPLGGLNPGVPGKGQYHMPPEVVEPHRSPAQ